MDDRSRWGLWMRSRDLASREVQVSCVACTIALHHCVSKGSKRLRSSSGVSAVRSSERGGVTMDCRMPGFSIDCRRARDMTFGMRRDLGRGMIEAHASISSLRALGEDTISWGRKLLVVAEEEEEEEEVGGGATASSFASVVPGSLASAALRLVAGAMMAAMCRITCVTNAAIIGQEATTSSNV